MMRNRLLQAFFLLLIANNILTPSVEASKKKREREKNEAAGRLPEGALPVLSFRAQSAAQEPSSRLERPAQAAVQEEGEEDQSVSLEKVEEQDLEGAGKKVEVGPEAPPNAIPLERKDRFQEKTSVHQDIRWLQSSLHELDSGEKQESIDEGAGAPPVMDLGVFAQQPEPQGAAPQNLQGAEVGAVNAGHLPNVPEAGARAQVAENIIPILEQLQEEQPAEPQGADLQGYPLAGEGAVNQGGGIIDAVEGVNQAPGLPNVPEVGTVAQGAQKILPVVEQLQEAQQPEPEAPQGGPIIDGLESPILNPEPLPNVPVEREPVGGEENIIPPVVRPVVVVKPVASAVREESLQVHRRKKGLLKRFGKAIMFWKKRKNKD